MFIRIPVFNANSIQPDLTPRYAASEQGLYCLPVSLLRDARHKRVIRKSYVLVRNLGQVWCRVKRKGKIVKQ